jgi:Do/DeqQ family serine protease
MRIRSLFSSRDFFLLNVALVSMLLGAILTALVFSCTTVTNPARSVSAQDRPALALEEIAGVPNSFKEVAEYIIPSVVEIRMQGALNGATAAPLDAPGDSNGERRNRMPGEFNFGPGDGDSSHPQVPGLGSGVVISTRDDTHYLITNNHVVGSAGNISVVTFEAQVYQGTLVGTDPRRDLAVVSFQTTSDDRIPAAPMGDSDSLSVGDWVLAVGNPFGFSSTITAGIVSAKGRSGPLENISDFLQTDAAINQGNSGGPLVDLRGEVVGINTWITTTSGFNAGLGFSIPINNIKKAIADIIATGEVENGWLGVEVEDITSMTAQQLAYAGSGGAFIAQVYAFSPAEISDLRPGDIVVSIEDVEVRDFHHLVRIIGDAPTGSVARISLFRNGGLQVRTVRIGRRESDENIQFAGRSMWPGVTLLPLTSDLRSTLGVVDDAIHGLIVHELKYAAAPQAAGIRQGDIVISINGRGTKNLLDFYQVVNDTETREFFVKIYRRGEILQFSVTRSRTQ